MSGNKTKETSANPIDFLAAIEDSQKRADCSAILELMAQLSGEAPKMWGTSIVGFGSYHYKYASGREGDFMRTGFSPRKQNITLYIMGGFSSFADLLARLGKHKTGKSCLYIKRLQDVDTGILKQLIAESLAYMAKKYPH